MESDDYINCTKCKVVQKVCRIQEGKGPKWCPTLSQKEAIETALRSYKDPAINEFARQASIQEGECYANRNIKPYIMYPIKTRIEEIIEFCQKMKFKRIGIAYCGGVTHEASMVSDILEKHGLEVFAVSCKVGGFPKETIGIKDEEKIRIGEFEPMCNPIAQAEVLNSLKTDFNIMLCLCVGHDSLFLKYIKGLATVLAVKDRVTGHNPLAALYTANSYYQRLKKLELGSDEEMKARMVSK